MTAPTSVYVATDEREYEGSEVEFASTDLEAAKAFVASLPFSALDDRRVTEWRGAERVTVWERTNPNEWRERKVGR